MTPTEQYVLGLIVEEKDEVGQLIGQALRFGLDTPGVKRLDGTIDMEHTPRSMLAVELGDIAAAISFAILHDIVDGQALSDAMKAKLAKLTDPSARDNLGRPFAPQPQPQPQPPSSDGAHPSHKLRSSDSSMYDVICTRCGRTDITGGGWGMLTDPCLQPEKPE